MVTRTGLRIILYSFPNPKCFWCLHSSAIRIRAVIMQKILIFLLLFSVLSISDLLILLRQAFYHGTHLLHYAARAYHLYVPVLRHLIIAHDWYPANLLYPGSVVSTFIHTISINIWPQLRSSFRRLKGFEFPGVHRSDFWPFFANLWTAWFYCISGFL